MSNVQSLLPKFVGDDYWLAVQFYFPFVRQLILVRGSQGCHHQSGKLG